MMNIQDKVVVTVIASMVVLSPLAVTAQATPKQSYSKPTMQGRYKVRCTRTHGTTYSRPHYHTKFIMRTLGPNSIRAASFTWGSRRLHRASHLTFSRPQFRI